MAIFEFVMLVCFGMSWPISVYKSFTSKSAKGKSCVFMVAIIIGYISGIIGKIVSDQIMVSIDFVLYFINKHNENKSMPKPEKVLATA